MSDEARKRLISGVYDRSAEGYGNIGYFPLYGKRLVELADIAPGAHVLDVACGRGAVLFAAAEAVGASGNVVGVDISPEMAAQTDADTHARGITNAAALPMDAEALDFSDNSFDRVLCAFSLQFFPGLDNALREFLRVLKPGGRVAVSTWGPDDPAWDWYDDLVASYGARASLRTQKLDSPEQVAGFFRAAAFTDITAVVEDNDFVYPEASDWWNVRWNLSGRAALEQIEDIERFTAEANATLESQRKPDGFHELHNVIYTLASKP